jgi:CHAT domain-containing protein
MQNQILQSGNQTLIKQYKDWKTKRAYLSKLSQLSLQEKEKQGITPEIEKKLANEANELEREISQVSEIFIKTLDKKVYQWKDIQQTLKKNEAVLEIIRINKDDAIHYIILAITSKTQQHPEMILLENGKELETDFINYYRNCIKFQKEDKFSYTKFFGEILEKIPSLKNKKRIYISPDGVYHQLNLLTLKNPKNNQYLADEFNIRLISNPKDLITFAQKPQKQIRNFKEYQIHLFGYPQYLINAPSIPDSMLIDKKRSFTFKFDENSSFFTKEGKISSLPGTKIEVENIENTAKSKKVKTLVYMNQDASEDNLKKLQNPDFLHIATHGFFLGGSSETEDDETRLTNLENKKYVKNPLLHSGLLLAGAENTIQTSENKIDTEDGILTADEAVSLNLDKTELVVLSACETGLGEIYNGEGVYGLQRAFQQAGAKTIIMSLWKVDDNATQEMMSLFYQNLLLKKQDKRKAFQNAQKTLKKKFPNPYYWGAFVMIGE